MAASNKKSAEQIRKEQEEQAKRQAAAQDVGKLANYAGMYNDLTAKAPAALDAYGALSNGVVTGFAPEYSSGMLEAANAADGGFAAASAGSGANAASSGTPYFDVGAPSYAGYASAALGAANAAKNFDNRPNDQKATYAQQQAALAYANVLTGGLAGMAEGFGRKQWGGTMAKLDKLDQKTNPLSVLANHFNVFGSKSAEQQGRDIDRHKMLERKMINPDWTIGLSDGSRYDIGIDGKHRLADGRKPWEIDMSKDYSGQDIGYINPLATIITGGDAGQRTSDLVGQLVNAARSGKGDPIKNMVGFYKQAGLNSTAAIDRINKLEQLGLIDKVRADAYRGGVGQLKSAFGALGTAPAQAGIAPMARPIMRSTTRSPGILKDGTRINYGQ